jgi:SAM-dependent methyltransferase
MSFEECRRHYFEGSHEEKEDASGACIYADPDREAAHRDALPYLEQLPMDFQTILDIGCSAGYESRWLAERGKAVTGITANPTPAQTAYAEAHGFKIERMDVHQLEYGDGSFDAILCRHCLEHCVAPIFALWEMRRVLKPGGYLFLAVPPHSTYWIESGHFTIGWGVEHVIYTLALAGFDVADGAFRERGYNIEAIVRKAGSIPPVKGLYVIKHLMPDPIRRAMRDDLHGAYPNLGFTEIGWPFVGDRKTTRRAEPDHLSNTAIRPLIRNRLARRGTIGKILARLV